MGSDKTIYNIKHCLNSQRIELIDELINCHNRSDQSQIVSEILEEPQHTSIYDFLAFNIKSSLSSLSKSFKI